MTRAPEAPGHWDYGHPSADLRELWSAVRARLSVDHPWLVAALFRAVPVALTTQSTPPCAQPPPVSVDRWGRIYLHLESVSSLPIEALAQAAQAAVLDWVSGQCAAPPWAVERLDDRFPAVASTQSERAGRTVAAGVLSVPRPRHGRDGLGAWREWATKTAGPPQITWQQHLGASVRAAVTTQSGHSLRTYARPSRRAQPGLVLPSSRAIAVNLAVVADISGSISADLPTVLAEIERITNAVGLRGGGVTLYTVDDEVAEVISLRGNRVDLQARAGHLTDLRPGFAAALRAHPCPDILIVLTDGLTPWPEQRPAAATIVALIGHGTVIDDVLPSVPPWATTLRIET